MQPTILFITRNYPPKTGGLENYSFCLIRAFEKTQPVFKVTSSHSNRHLLWFLPYCLVRALYLSWRNRIGFVHLCDGVLAPIGLVLKKLTGARVSISIHGLDVTFPNRLFQAVIPRCVARLDRVICVSRATREQCLARGIPRGRCTVIPNGVDPAELRVPHGGAHAREALSGKLGLSLEGRKVLVTVGRLVPRKGVEWFVAHVMPELDPNFLYLIVGDGPQKAAIRRAIEKNSLGERVFVLGPAADDLRNLTLNAADIFVMPNIRIPADVEGFGIVALEAGSVGLPVVASAVQGIKDAVIDGTTGYLVPERDARGFLDRILTMDLDRGAVRSAVGKRFDWQRIAARYSDAIFSNPEPDDVFSKRR